MENIKFTIDTSEVEAALLDLTSQFSDSLLEVINSLVCSPKVFPKLFRIEVDRLMATGAHDVRTVLKTTDLYVQLMVTLRALEVDELVIEKAGHV